MISIFFPRGVQATFMLMKKKKASHGDVLLSEVSRIAAERKKATEIKRYFSISESIEDSSVLLKNLLKKKKKKKKNLRVFVTNGSSVNYSVRDGGEDSDIPLSRLFQTKKRARERGDIMVASGLKKKKKKQRDFAAFAPNGVSCISFVRKDATESACNENDVLISWDGRVGKHKKERVSDLEFRVSEDDEESRVKKKQFRGLEEAEEKPSQGLEVDNDLREKGDSPASKEVEMVESEISGIGGFTTGDIVWAKASRSTWWPGWICKRDHRGVLVSFFACERNQYCQESEICGFEKNFQVMSKKIGWSLSAALDCALEELGRRVALGLICPCLGSVEDVEVGHPTNVGQHAFKQSIEVKKSFQPLEVLSFVLRMALRTCVENEETVSATRAAAQVHAFRRHVSIRPDWMYRETMMLSESFSASDDSDATMGTYPEVQFHLSLDDEIMPSVTQESGIFTNQENKKELFSEQMETDFSICMTNKLMFRTLDSNEFEYLCEDQVEDVNLSSASMEEDYFSVEDDIVVQNPASGSVSQQLKLKEMSKDGSGSEFCLYKEPVSPVNLVHEEKKLCENDFEGHSDRETSSDSFPVNTLETMEQHWDGIPSVCRQNKLDDSVINLVPLFPKNMNNKSANFLEPDTSLRRESDELLFPLVTLKKPKAQLTTPNSVAKQSQTGYLHEMLRHLHCLALDPFYLGTKSLKIIQRNFLKYRVLSYNNIPDLASQIYFLVETNEAPVSFHIGNNNNVETQPSDKVDSSATFFGEEIDNAENMSNLVSPVKSCDCFNSNAKLGQPDVSDPLLLCKHQSFSSDACLQKARTEVEAQRQNDFYVEPLVLSTARTSPSKESKRHPLRDMLTHLHCLALDPFYSGVQSSKSVSQNLLDRFYSGAESSASVCRMILKYRDLVYHNTLHLYPVKHISDRGHEVKVGKMLNVSRLDSASHQCNFASRRQSEKNVGFANNGNTHKSKLFSHVQEDVFKIEDETTTEDRSEVVEVYRFSSQIQEPSSIDPESKDAVDTHPSDKVYRASDVTGKSPLISDDLIKSAGAASNVTNRRLSSGTISESCDRKRKLDQPVASLELPKAYPLFAANRLYASPLLMDRSASTSNVQCQSSNSHSQASTSLHIKFPKDFNMPSKDELVKKFSPFGPVDHLKTRVFFYTGAAQVVFLHQLDAVAAYQYARKKTLFGQVNVRFWLDRHERARKGNNMPASLSLSTVGSSALNLKSCLKTPNLDGANGKRKAHKVKFLTENHSLAATVEANKTPQTVSDSPCRVWRDIGPDISQQMLMLLENCSELVCQIKDSYGLQSYYSIFSLNYFGFMKSDD